MSVADAIASPIPVLAGRGPVDRPVAWFAAAAILLLTLLTAVAIDVRQSLLVLLGAGFGLTLFHASFGFTGGWRALVVEGARACGRRCWRSG